MKWLAVACAAALATLAAAGPFETKRFDVQANIGTDGRVAMSETIEVRFNQRQHGLIRSIPVRAATSDGRSRGVGLELVGVTQDGANATVKAGVSRGVFEVRIGDRDRWVNGSVRYRLDYNLEGALTPISSTDPPTVEWLWNVLPTKWATVIEASRIVVRFPQPPQPRYRARILVGRPGTRFGVEIDQDNHQVGGSERLAAKFDGNRLAIDLAGPLQAGETMTLALSLPEGTTVAAPPQMEPAPSDQGRESPLPQGGFWPFLSLAPLLGIPAIYAVTRRLWAPKRPLVVRFDPPDGVEAAWCGLIEHGKFARRDLVASFVSLAQKGALRMHRRSADASGVDLELLDEVRARNLTPFESEVLGALAPYAPVATPEAMQGSFAPSFQSLAASANSHIDASSFRIKDGAGKSLMGCSLIAVTVLLGLFTCAFNPLWSIPATLAALVMGGVFVGKVSPLTAKGQIALAQIAGLKEFIGRAHEKELNYMAERAPDQALFETLLPYAVSFGMVQQWTRAFEGIELAPPTWYDGGYDLTTGIWTAMLVDDLVGLDQEIDPAIADFGTGEGWASGDSAFGGGFDSDSGSFDGGFDAGDGGGGGGGDSW